MTWLFAQNEESSPDEEEDDPEELESVTWPMADDHEDDEDNQRANTSSASDHQDASARGNFVKLYFFCTPFICIWRTVQVRVFHSVWSRVLKSVRFLFSILN